MLETIRTIKSKYFNKGIYENSDNVRETWKVINSTLGRNTTTILISEFSCGVNHILTKNVKAVKINQHFCLLGKIGQGYSSYRYSPRTIQKQGSTNVQRWPQDPYFLFHPQFYTSLRCGNLK